jgi:hypothetical protein
MKRGCSISNQKKKKKAHGPAVDGVASFGFHSEEEIQNCRFFMEDAGASLFGHHA